MELHRYFRVLAQRWWLIFLIVATGTASAVYYTLQQPPVYSSTVTLLLSPAFGQDTLIPGSLSERTSQLALTYSRYLQTRTFAEIVIEREGLNISPDELVRSIQAQVVEGTQFFEITATSNDPRRAQMLATVIANNFIAENIAQQREQLAASRAARDVDNMQTLLQEKLERERQYYDQKVAGLRQQVAQIRTQPPSTARDELLASTQEQLSEYEDRLLQIMNDQIALQPVQDNTQINTVTVIEPAPLPTRPTNIQYVQNVVLAMASSLILGIMLAFALEYLDYTVKSPEELEELTGQPALSVISETKANGKGRKKADSPLITLAHPNDPVSEAFRSLRTNIQYSQAGRQMRSLVVTSAGPGEGKTTVAANLAVVMAQSGKRVLLVDADLRRPTVHKLFGLVNNLGLATLMLAENPTDPRTIHNHLQPGPVGSLRILTSGPIPPNPAELFSTEWAQGIFAALEEQADVVIYDTPPALTVTDPVILASRADATLLIVRAGQTRRDVVLKTMDVLQRVGGHVLAPILNRVKSEDIGYYYHYYYYGKYGYRSEESPEKGQKSHHNGRHRRSSRLSELFRTTREGSQ